MSSQRVNQPRRHRDTEILCVSVASSLRALRLLCVDDSERSYRTNPNTVSLPSVATKTFPFTTSGMLNFAAESRASRDPI